MKYFINKQCLLSLIKQASPVLLLIFCIIVPRCKSDLPEDKINEVDSLMALTLNLQKKISSPEIQKLNDLISVISNDLSLFTDPDLQEFSSNKMRKELEEYITLQADIENCLSACKNYNEEIFLIENNLTDIQNKITSDFEYPEKIGELIDTEKVLLDDLLMRIDSSLNYIDKHLERYYYLKPKIDELKQTLTEK
jgi:hypothetical protein